MTKRAYDFQLTLPLIPILLLAPLTQSGCTRVAEVVKEQRDKNDDAPRPSADRPAPAADAGPVMTCSECEHMPHKGNTNCPDSTRRCETLAGNTAPDSPRPNTSKAKICQEIVDCFHRTHCAKNYNATDCLCGKDVNPDKCFAGKFEDTTGACRDLVAAGGESKAMDVLADRFSDAMYAIGVADTVLETCDFQSCERECL